MRRSSPRARRALAGLTVALTLLTGTGLALANSLDKARAGSVRGTQCLPSTLNRSAILPGSDLSVSPLPESYDASTHTQISLLGSPAREIKNLHVSGSVERRTQRPPALVLPGRRRELPAERTIRSGETVRVEGELDTRAGMKPFDFQFTVAYADPINPPPISPTLKLGAGEYQSFHSAPQLHPPDVDVTESSRASKTLGDIFAAPYSGPGMTDR